MRMLRASRNFQKNLGKRLFLMHYASHFIAVDHEGGAGGDGRRSGQTQPSRSGKRLLAHKVSRSEQRDGGFSADSGNDSDFGATFLNKED